MADENQTNANPSPPVPSKPNPVETVVDKVVDTVKKDADKVSETVKRDVKTVATSGGKTVDKFKAMRPSMWHIVDHAEKKAEGWIHAICHGTQEVFEGTIAEFNAAIKG